MLLLSFLDGIYDVLFFKDKGKGNKFFNVFLKKFVDV